MKVFTLTSLFYLNYIIFSFYNLTIFSLQQDYGFNMAREVRMNVFRIVGSLKHINDFYSFMKSRGIQEYINPIHII
jgi:hypothetical protein